MTPNDLVLYSIDQCIAQLSSENLVAVITMNTENPQLFNLQRIRDFRVQSPKWDVLIRKGCLQKRRQKDL